MSGKLIIALMSVLLFIPGQSFAANSPSNLDPKIDSVTTDLNPKLSWGASGPCPADGSCYRVEVSDNKDFETLTKSTYTNNTYYSPTLSEGTWFWRVKAKDSEGVWSEFANSKIIITKTQGSETISQSPLPLISAPPTPSPTPKPVSEFTIISPTTTLSKDTSAKVEVKMTKLSPNTTYFIKSAFYKEGKTNYFAKTKVNDVWVKNAANFSEQRRLTTDNEGNWTGSLETMIDIDDAGYDQSGQYFLKVGRYNASGSSLSWSNSLSVTINAEKEQSKTSPAADETEKNQTINQINTTDTESETELTSQVLGSETQPSPEATVEYKLPDLAQEDNNQLATASATEVLVKGERQLNWWFITSGLVMFILMGITLVHTRKKRYHQL